jgi:hypothetical protein
LLNSLTQLVFITSDFVICCTLTSYLNTSHYLCRPLRWDEGNLELNESERVPRMKITEPKTPYRQPEEDSGDEHFDEKADREMISDQMASEKKDK